MRGQRHGAARGIVPLSLVVQNSIATCNPWRQSPLDKLPSSPLLSQGSYSTRSTGHEMPLSSLKTSDACSSLAPFNSSSIRELRLNITLGWILQGTLAPSPHSPNPSGPQGPPAQHSQGTPRCRDLCALTHSGKTGFQRKLPPLHSFSPQAPWNNRALPPLPLQGPTAAFEGFV